MKIFNVITILTIGEESIILDPKKNQAQQGLEIEKLTAFSEQAKKLQEQQSFEIEKLKEAIANAMANLGNEREAKQEALRER